ncbi:DHH family phosphoesterase [Litchfieldia salsa]|uniref:Phosphoesterase RecJ domain-containing protein n=1 Tax=Litchfieldia salsa TaxID=930152 RepID=A0A1H0P3Y4_9BACI|nr:bifunctional oligoribonuclease/PAP phosphatase NrnA [Litchfieldia salsa]SDO99438.1 phosphoesterase RecJ domain-containing protein [Litchfieldia salsa]
MKEQIISLIKQYNTVIIHRHVRPDPDAYGSQCGLAELLKATFPNKSIFVVGKGEETLEFLYQMDTIPDSTYKGALAIVCDTANQERVCDQRYTLADKVIKIDHHPNEDPYGDLMWVDTSSSSTSELIYELYLHGKDNGLTLTKEAARLIYAGIIGDTGRFLFPSTNPRTFTYAGELVSHDFSFPEIYENLYNTKQNVSRLSGYVLQNFNITEHGVASMSISNEILQKFDVSPSDASQLVRILGNIDGIEAWVFFVEEEDQIRVRLRSKGPVINKIAQKYGGGGHPLAAGASIHSWDEVHPLVEDLNKLCQK